MTREEQIDDAAQRAFNIEHPISAVSEMFSAPLTHAFKDGAEWADAHPRWISVEDELPPKESEYEDNSIVVLATDGNNVYKGLYRSGEYLSGWFTCDLWELDDITHWMPMPQPPSSSEIPNNLKKGD